MKCPPYTRGRIILLLLAIHFLVIGTALLCVSTLVDIGESAHNALMLLGTLMLVAAVLMTLYDIQYLYQRTTQANITFDPEYENL
jgi:hypothetical protein